MRHLYFLFLIYFTSPQFVIGQTGKTTTYFKILDDSHFGWKQFSFAGSFDKIKVDCGLSPMYDYSWDYLNSYCGEINDTSKSYFFSEFDYHEFGGIKFNTVFLRIEGSRNKYFSKSSVFFLNKYDAAISAKKSYDVILNVLKQKFGYCESKLIDDDIEETEWVGSSNIILSLRYYKLHDMVMLTAKENSSRFLFDHLYQQSEYNEKLTDNFKEFDRKNGFKGLKFGMTKVEVQKLVKLKKEQTPRSYEVLNDSYKYWYDMQFDYCAVDFNKSGKLYSVNIVKNDYSTKQYNDFMDDIGKLFGHFRDFKMHFDENMISSLWEGHKVNVMVGQTETTGLLIQFYSDSLDDSDPSDKLY